MFDSQANRAVEPTSVPGLNLSPRDQDTHQGHYSTRQGHNTTRQGHNTTRQGRNTARAGKTKKFFLHLLNFFFIEDLFSYNKKKLKSFLSVLFMARLEVCTSMVSTTPIRS